MSHSSAILSNLSRFSPEIQETILTEQVKSGAVRSAEASKWVMSESGWPDDLKAGFTAIHGQPRQPASLPGSCSSSTGTASFGGPSITGPTVKDNIDELLTAVGEVPGNSREALAKLQEYMNSVGADAIYALGSGPSAANRGFGYINSRLQAMGIEQSFKPLMDARTRAWIKLAEPGEISGRNGTLRVAYRPYSSVVREGLRKQGRPQTGMWSVAVEGIETHDKRVADDGSTSGKQRFFHDSMAGGDQAAAIKYVTSEILGGELPIGYNLTIDLSDTPEEARPEAKALLARELGALKIPFRFDEVDIAAEKVKVSRLVKVNERIDQLIAKEMTNGERQEFLELQQEYRELQSRPY